jgi:DNA-directed RNA polymerase subunit M
MFPSGAGKMKCKKCGHEVAQGGGTGAADEPATRTRSLKEEKQRLVVDKNEPELLPKIRITCPKCSGNEAYWMIQQTRGADEAPTRFYICTKCAYRWREYS